MLSWIPTHARALRNRNALHGKTWSLAQVCEHLALIIRGTTEAPAPGEGTPHQRETFEGPWSRLSPLGRLKRRVMLRALLWSGRFPSDVPSPKFVVPSDAPDLAEAIAALESAIEAFNRKHAQPNARWVNHPLLGPMTGDQWQRFHIVHARHHFAFIKHEG
jgi:hypothetical protein